MNHIRRMTKRKNDKEYILMQLRCMECKKLQKNKRKVLPEYKEEEFAEHICDYCGTLQTMALTSQK